MMSAHLTPFTIDASDEHEVQLQMTAGNWGILQGSLDALAGEVPLLEGGKSQPCCLYAREWAGVFAVPNVWM